MEVDEETEVNTTSVRDNDVSDTIEHIENQEVHNSAPASTPDPGKLVSYDVPAPPPWKDPKLPTPALEQPNMVVR
jgi:hypothetical protein